MLEGEIFLKKGGGILARRQFLLDRLREDDVGKLGRRGC